jgi:hypothetical protein
MCSSLPNPIILSLFRVFKETRQSSKRKKKKKKKIISNKFTKIETIYNKINFNHFNY